MSEQLPNPEYIEHYPDAIQDTEKAHTMAKAGDYYETEAADYRTVAQAIIDQGAADSMGKAPLDQIDTLGNVRLHDALERLSKDIVDSGEGDPDGGYAGISDDITWRIHGSQEVAEQEYASATEDYDALEATKNRIQIPEHSHLADHPRAERDAEKAHVMAMAMNHHESESAAVRYVTEFVMTSRWPGVDVQNQSIRMEPDEVSSKMAGEQHVHDYDDALERLSDNGIIDDEGNAKMDDIVDLINGNNQFADDIAKVVGNAHDSLKATKR